VKGKTHWSPVWVEQGLGTLVLRDLVAGWAREEASMVEKRKMFMMKIIRRTTEK
jgi:hypothetical protein